MPTLAAKADFRSLALTAVEGFVLSRVDGATSVADICQVTGLGEAATISILERLSTVGAIRLGPEDAPAVAAPSAAAAPPAVAALLSDEATGPSSLPAPPAPAPAYDPRELEENVDIEPERRKRILDLYYALPDMNFYDLLEVEPSAVRKEIREAYFAKSKEYHPDTLFRRSVGSFKEKMEIIFRSLTQAYDVLTNKNQRLDYDVYIAEQLKTREAERQLREATLEAERMERDLVESVQRARRQARTRRESEARRRAALAQKLAAMSGRTIARREAPSERPRRSAAETAAEVRRLLQGSSQIERIERAKAHATAARAALGRKEHVAAANALRLAMTLDPRNEEYGAEFAHASTLAARDLSEGYAKQGKFEEQLGHFDRACEHYCKAADGNPESAVFAERAAAMLVTLRRDLRKAQEYALRGVQRHPKEVRYRLTLIKVYVEANLPRSAKREIDAGLGLEPKNPELLELAKTVKKML